MDVCAYLKQLREERGLSQRQLAVYSGVSHATISRIESGDTQPSMESLVKLAPILRIETQKLLAVAGFQDSVGADRMDDELTAILQQAKDRPEIRALFSISKNASKEDVEKTIDIIKVLRQSNTDYNQNER